MIPIEQRDGLLPHKSNSADRKFNGKGLFVDGFENPGPSYDRTAIAAAMIDSVISESLNNVPAFLLSSDISNGSLRAAFSQPGSWAMGTVGVDSCSINSSGVLSGGRGGDGFLGACRRIPREIFRETLRRPRACLAKGTDGVRPTMLSPIVFVF